VASLTLIIPTVRRDAFDDPAWLFDLKLDGFRGLADTIASRMLSKNGNQLKRFEPLLEALPAGYVFDGEIVALGEDGRPRFYDLMFGRSTSPSTCCSPIRRMCGPYP
jgi:bifunctional non-homologous end joining protein LigD